MLESNLVSLSGQPFLWLCDEADAEGLRVARELIGRHPECRITLLLCPPCPDGENPKVFKIIRAIPHVETPLILVLDDDTHLSAVTAATLARHARTHGIATGLPEYSNEGDVRSALLEQFVNNNSAVTYLSLLPLMRPLSINGMCYVMKSEDMAMFPPIARHLTDDLALAQAVRAKGGGIYQSSHPQCISTEVSGPGQYWRLMHRWFLFAMLLLRQQPARLKLLIFLLHGWPPLALWTVLVVALIERSVAGWWLLAGFLVVRALLIVAVQVRLYRRWAHRPVLSVVSELLQPLHLVHALLDRTIIWRSRRYRVHAIDQFEDANG